MNLENRISAELEKAGITINGNSPFDPQIHNNRVYNRVALHGTLGLGESYVDGDWDCEDLPEFLTRCILSGLDQKYKGFEARIYKVLSKIFNDQSPKRAMRVADHYNLSNEFYKRFLGQRMIYTSASLVNNPDTLDEAQVDKMRWYCEALKIKPGQRVLDIGCGWGGFAELAAREYGAVVDGVTISTEQIPVAITRCANLDVSIHKMDWREMPMRFGTEYFDHIVSIEMAEAVGLKNLRHYMETVAYLMKPNGLFGLQLMMGKPGTDPWINRYIFPGGYIPSFMQLMQVIEGVLILEKSQNLGTDYDWTLGKWRYNLDTHWDELQAMDPDFYDLRLYRILVFYLSSCAASFRARVNHSCQMILSRQDFARV